jgi:Mrp family chromosome partitioning ATPase
VEPSYNVPSFRQATVSDDHLAPPPEYLPEGLALRQEPEFPLSAAELGATAGLPSSAAANTAGQASSAAPALRQEPSITVAEDGAPLRKPYDELAEAVLAQIAPGRPAALWFTSVEEDIGRTAMVASLAAALARRQSQGVLAVDADFRLGSHFGVPSDPGLAGVLGGRVAWEQAIAAIGIPSLFVLPAGRTGPGDPEADRLPWADRLAPLLEQWCSRFRLVLVDAPSLVRPEAASLARHFHGSYLALRLGRTRQRALRRALQALEAAGGRLLGSILLGPPGAG